MGILGTHTIQNPAINSEERPVHRTIPLVTALMRTEAGPCIENMVKVLQDVIQALFSEKAILGVGRQDHSFAILNGFNNRGVEVKANCHVHLDRGVNNNKSRLHNADYLEVIQKDIEVCHLQAKRFRFELLTKGYISN